MRLGEALQISARTASANKLRIQLLCGFTPLHLETFVKAHLCLRFPGSGIEVQTGLFGDLEGNLQRASENGAMVVLEWGDLDPRLGYRSSSGWGLETLDDITAQVEEKCGRLERALKQLAQITQVVLAGPTLGLPPLDPAPPSQVSALELRLDAILSKFLGRIGSQAGVRLVSSSALARSSPVGARHEVKLDLLAGFPYTLTHADAVAELSTACLFPAAPKKGLITDLDQTLWKGIIGDDGVDAVSWSIEGKSQAHALYQQLLASLADSGVLVAIASKNDPEFVEAVLQRRDLLLRPEQVFPIEVSWGPKSQAVGRILEAWNIGADSVVMVDDSPLELAEVEEKFPGIEGLRFPSDDPSAIVELLWKLRARFGKSEIREEDRLRLESLRASARLRKEKAPETSSDFLERLNAKIRLDDAGTDHRAFELVNKTNQFNLNGARYTEAEWRSFSSQPGAFLATIAYEDRFGPLGRIAVLGGRTEWDVCFVDIWVMSCRAFSRQIEFQCIRQLFAKSGASEIRFRFRPTDRNGPLQTFLAHFVDGPLGEGELKLRCSDFERLCPPLFHQVEDPWTLLKKN